MKKQFSYGAILAVCVGIGAAIGSATGAIAQGVALGAAFGASLGMLFGKRCCEKYGGLRRCAGRGRVGAAANAAGRR